MGAGGLVSSLDVWRRVAVIDSELGYCGRRLDAIESAIQPIAIEINRNGFQQTEFSRQLTDWIQESRRMRKDLDDLRLNSTARPDPFTGSDGRELERRIKALEGK
jgi:hypothetical protein